MDKRYFIFGTSNGSQDFLSNFEQEDFEKIIGFLDNDEEKQGKTFFDKKIFSPEEILNTDFDKIIIASSFFKDIKWDLLNLGVDENKISVSIKREIHYQGIALCFCSAIYLFKHHIIACLL